MIPTYNSTLEGKYGIAKRPTYNGKGTDIINGLAFTVSAGTKHPEEAIDFALWLGGKEAQEIQGKSGTVISARNDCQDLYLDTHKDLNLQVFLDNVAESRPFAHCKVTSELGNASKPFLEQAWKGEITLQEAAKQAEAAQNEVLDKMNSK